MPSTLPRIRCGMLDAARGAAVINMIAYHLCYDIFCVFGVWLDFQTFVPAVIWERLICFSFIIISGAVTNFSQHGIRRGVIVSLCGFAITVVTVLITPEQSIWFGVLSLLGCAMLAAHILRRELSRIRPAVGCALFLVLFALCYGIPDGYIGLFSLPLIRLPEALYRYRFLAFMGFPPEGFFSADYFPILPWSFLFLFGGQLWRLLVRKGLDRRFAEGPRLLRFVGRHSLIIYMAHQPILYGLCYAVFSLIK